MRRKEIPKTKKHTNKHFVITFPDDVKEQYPELVKKIASLSPKQRGKIILSVFIMAGIALKEPDIEKKFLCREEKNKEKKETAAEKKQIKQSDITKNDLKGLKAI